MDKGSKEIMTDHDLILVDLRRQRDTAAAVGDHAEAMILNDRIKDLKEGRTGPTVERRAIPAT